MQIEEFVNITRSVIRRDGFENYMPTAYFPARRHIVVLEDVPDNVDIETVSLQWAAEKAKQGEEYFVAFKVNSTQFKVMRFSGRDVQEDLFNAYAG